MGERSADGSFKSGPLRIGWIALAGFSLASCDQRPNQWDAFIYPNGNDLTTSKTIKGFKTFELCQSAAISELRSLPDPDRGDYECGYKCEFDPNIDIHVCKETRR
ncbi:hypothetical protein CDQ91_00040 [Sphingopyxis witflariensis]|uniref:Lipoprotein n=1 Tax=Sphingopyxis witflariensis TaxID=173675 RepID=A0A246K4Z5_9SPHN|nr:hypothetical protein CDQ91_00040 [Sphingopyxis witflariensis]